MLVVLHKMSDYYCYVKFSGIRSWQGRICRMPVNTFCTTRWLKPVVGTRPFEMTLCHLMSTLRSCLSCSEEIYLEGSQGMRCSNHPFGIVAGVTPSCEHRKEKWCGQVSKMAALMPQFCYTNIKLMTFSKLSPHRDLLCIANLLCEADCKPHSVNF